MIKKTAPLIVILLLSAVPPLPAWTPVTQEAIAENASRFMPLSLRRLLYKHAVELKEGAVDPFSFGDDENHYYHLDGSYGTLPIKVNRQVEKIRLLIERRSPFKKIVYEMGVLSHYVADASHPLHTGSDDPEERLYIKEFNLLTEKKMDKIRIVFNSLSDPYLEQGNPAAFVANEAVRANRYYEWISSSFMEGGRVLSYYNFNDKHPVFGVASLSFSNAVNNVGKLWFYIWKTSNGDVSDLPFKLIDNTTYPRRSPGLPPPSQKKR